MGQGRPRPVEYHGRLLGGSEAAVAAEYARVAAESHAAAAASMTVPAAPSTEVAPPAPEIPGVDGRPVCVGPCRLVREIRRGGQAVVHLAVDQLRAAPVASRERVRIRRSGPRSSAAAISPQRDVVAASDGAGTTHVRELRGRESAALHVDGARVLDVAFSADGAHVATASSDCAVRLWDRTGRRVRSLTVPDTTFTWVEFAPDGRRLELVVHLLPKGDLVFKALGVAQVRSGRPAEAIGTLTDAMRTRAERNVVQSEAPAVLAIAHSRLGHAADARA